MTVHRTNPASRPPARRQPANRRWLLVVVATTALVLTACGASGDSGSADESGEEEASFADTEDAAETVTVEPGGDTMADEAEAPVAEAADVAPSQGEALGAGGATVTPTAADLGRKLIFTADVHVEVDDVAAASAEATRIVQDLGGFVFGQNTTGGSEPSSELVFKILPDDFNRALEALGTVGELRNQSVFTDDVTERIVDLESRIQVAELGVERLRTALTEALTLEDYAEVERLLLSRESELEVMRGQLRTLEDRVDLSTITLLLTQDRVENAIQLTISTYETHDNGASCPGQQDRSVEEGGDVTLCFDIVNVGDQTLTDIVLTDTGVDIDADTALIEVFGTLESLAPGQSVLVAHQITADRSSLRLRTRVVAIPTDGVSPEPAGPSVSTQLNTVISTFEPDRDPGFGDGWSASVGILQALWVALKVTIGFLILPLIILIPLVWLARRARQEYRRRRPPAPTPPPPGPPPAPPAPTGAPAVPAGQATATGPEAAAEQA